MLFSDQIVIFSKCPPALTSNTSFLTHGYSVGVFVSHRHHLISISAFFCVLIASSLLCAPGGNRLDQSRTSLVDFSREPVRPVYTLDLLFTCSLVPRRFLVMKILSVNPVSYIQIRCRLSERAGVLGEDGEKEAALYMLL